MKAGDLETYRENHMLKAYHSHNEKIKWFKNHPPMYTAIESLHGRIGLMCPHCYNYFIRTVQYFESIVIENEEPTSTDYPELWMANNISYVVPECKFCGKEEVELIQIDVNMVDSISKLNKKGYKTRFCCEGHEESTGYIMFEDNSIVKYLNTLPITWYIDLDNAITLNQTVIRSDICNYIESLMDLNEWVESLPDILYQCLVMNTDDVNKNYRGFPRIDICNELKELSKKYNIPFPDRLIPKEFEHMEGFKPSELQIQMPSHAISFKEISPTTEQIDKIFNVLKSRTNSAIYGLLSSFGNYDQNK